MKIRFVMNQATIAELQKNLVWVQKAVVIASTEAVDEIGALVLARAKAATPVRTSALYSSAFIEMEANYDKVIAHVGYGGKYNKLNPETLKWSDSYAVEVHESKARSDQSRKFGATWKFLEKALNSVKPDYDTLLAFYIKEALQFTGNIRISRK